MKTSSTEEKPKVDDAFYDRADSFIHLANEHCADMGRGKVSASFMYGMSRFNAWVSATGFDMKASRQETVDYIDHFDKYIANAKT